MPSGASGAAVELCADRACTKHVGTATVDASGTRAIPDQPLPKGVVYWRVSAGGAVSRTWEFSVGSRSGGAVDTSWGSMLDVDGDGYAEIATGSGNNTAVKGGVYLFAGGKNGIAKDAMPTILQGGSSWFGNAVASSDVNGDGYADLIVGSSIERRVYAFYGSATGMSASATPDIVGASVAGTTVAGVGYAVAPAGDVDGDGYADILVGDPSANQGYGLAFVFYGSETGLKDNPTTLNPKTTDVRFGCSVAAGDINGDGLPDLVVGAERTSTGRVYIYRGQAGGTFEGPVILKGPGPTNINYSFGHAVANAGDVNGDGYSDLIVGAPQDGDPSGGGGGSGRAYLYSGGAGGIAADATPVALIGETGPVPGDPRIAFGKAVAGLGDVDGDGYDDIGVGAPNYYGELGRAYVFAGGAGGITAQTAPIKLELPNHQSELASSLHGQDVDGDGHSDIVAGSHPSYDGETARLFLFMGGSTLSASSTPVVFVDNRTGGTMGQCVY
ncbi:hypothetical protein AKJ09_05899 [Labilithrix luteola]|uniref:Flagellar hook-length control protein FliK n=2 Tax=Labilithrix luteola TaxID=1391654 RepID=A0A0K1Q0D8_9BACT|nr:hypothetical protein AKJ09_05899 [Labilithrix luteola]